THDALGRRRERARGRRVGSRGLVADLDRRRRPLGRNDAAEPGDGVRRATSARAARRPGLVVATATAAVPAPAAAAAALRPRRATATATADPGAATVESGIRSGAAGVDGVGVAAIPADLGVQELSRHDLEVAGHLEALAAGGGVPVASTRAADRDDADAGDPLRHREGLFQA